ncbi:hypothetical protein LCGC14_0651320 [marine sediment metagenome]|uniref:Uncharacterized protein n=1 Tax=marine sediment metagenome TaxID=412755 RepID=A0A0F9RG03_9ZZZZ
MIDSEGRLRCDKCGTVIGEYVLGRAVIKCWRSHCKHLNIFKVDKTEKVVVES